LIESRIERKRGGRGKGGCSFEHFRKERGGEVRGHKLVLSFSFKKKTEKKREKGGRKKKKERKNIFCVVSSEKRGKNLPPFPHLFFFNPIKREKERG